MGQLELIREHRGKKRSLVPSEINWAQAKEEKKLTGRVAKKPLKLKSYILILSGILENTYILKKRKKIFFSPFSWKKNLETLQPQKLYKTLHMKKKIQWVLLGVFLGLFCIELNVLNDSMWNRNSNHSGLSLSRKLPALIHTYIYMYIIFKHLSSRG